MKTIRLHAFVFGKAFFRANCFRGVTQESGQGERREVWSLVGTFSYSRSGRGLVGTYGGTNHKSPPYPSSAAFKKEGGDDNGATRNHFHPFVFEVLPLFFL